MILKAFWQHKIEIKDFDMETGKLTMMMKGACSGCAGSTATLKKGIESTMKHYIPEVKTVEGEDDPNSDVKPYYEYNQGCKEKKICMHLFQKKIFDNSEMCPFSVTRLFVPENLYFKNDFNHKSKPYEYPKHVYQENLL